MTDNANILMDMLNSGQITPNGEHAPITKTSKVDGGMALSLGGEADKLSAEVGGIVLAEVKGEGDGGFGWSSQDRQIVVSEDGSEGGDITVADVMTESDMMWRYFRHPIPQTLDGSEAPAGVLDMAALYRVSDVSVDLDKVAAEAQMQAGFPVIPGAVFLGTVGRESFSLDLDPAKYAEITQGAIDKCNTDHGGTWQVRSAMEMKGGAYHGVQTTNGSIETPRGKMEGRLTMGTGYAGSDPFIAAISSVLAVCQNTYAHALEGGITLRHTKNMIERIDDMVQALVLGQSQINAEVKWMERADRVRIKLDDLVKRVAPLIFRSRDVDEDGSVHFGAGGTDRKVPNQTTRKREFIVNLAETQDTAIGIDGVDSNGTISVLDIAQALTYYTSHEFRGKKRKGGKDPMSTAEQHIHGTARDIQAQGWDVLYSLESFQENEAGVYLPA